MPTMTTPRRGRGAAVRALAVLVPLWAAGAAAAENPAWHMTQADVRISCPLTIGGSFEAKTNSLAGTVTLVEQRPPLFAGPLTVDLRTLDTGIGLRNEHMREKYLEVGRGESFASAVLSGIRLGDVDPGTFQGRTTFTGSFLLHGVTQAIAGQAEIHRVGSMIRLEASFPIVLPDYGIPKPRYLGIGVKDQVQVKVVLVATPVATETGGAR